MWERQSEGGRKEGDVQGAGRLREREIMYIYMYYIEWWLLYCYVYIDHQDDFIKAQTGDCDSVLEEGLKSRTSCKLPGDVMPQYVTPFVEQCLLSSCSICLPISSKWSPQIQFRALQDRKSHSSKALCKCKSRSPTEDLQTKMYHIRQSCFWFHVSPHPVPYSAMYPHDKWGEGKQVEFSLL